MSVPRGRMFRPREGTLESDDTVIKAHYEVV